MKNFYPRKPMQAVIIDIDGTLADVRSIRHLLAGSIFTTSEEMLDLYHKLAIDVPVVEPIYIFTQQALEEDVTLFFVTARKERYRQDTIDFLRRHEIEYHGLYMRADDDMRSDVELKKDILEKIRSQGYRVTTAFDDNPQIVEMWVSEGIPAYYVTGYGFNYE